MEIEDILGFRIDDLPDSPEYAFELFRNRNAKRVVDALREKGYDVVRLNEGGQDNFVILDEKAIAPISEAKKEAVKEDTIKDLIDKLPKAQKLRERELSKIIDANFDKIVNKLINENKADKKCS